MVVSAEMAGKPAVAFSTHGKKFKWVKEFLPTSMALLGLQLSSDKKKKKGPELMQVPLRQLPTAHAHDAVWQKPFSIDRYDRDVAGKNPFVMSVDEKVIAPPFH